MSLVFSQRARGVYSCARAYTCDAKYRLVPDGSRKLREDAMGKLIHRPEDSLRCRQGVKPTIQFRGGSRNSLKGGFWARILRRGGGVKVQVRGNFHILTSKKKKNQPLKGGGGVNPPYL